MDTITTTASLLTFNGSARPAMVALTPNEIRLIAAAPDLLSALRELDECYCEASETMTCDQRTRHRQVLMNARAAIARAEGKS